jgi:outer membrane protein TolC
MRIPVLVAAAFAIASPAAVAQPLTFEEATALALANQPLLAGQEAAVDSSRQNAIAEAQLPDPRLKLGINNLPVSGADQWSLTRDFMTMRSIGIEQMFPAAEKRHLRGERGNLEAALAAAELENLRRTIRRDVQLAWLGAYLPAQSMALLTAALVFYEQQRDAAEIALRAGRASLAELARLRVEIELQRDRLLDIAGQERKAHAELARWIGPAAHRPLADALPPQPPLPPIDTMRHGAQDHPQLDSARAEIALADNDVRQASAAYRSDWSLELMYSKRGPAYGDMVSVQVGVELPFFTANRQDRRLASKLAAKTKHEQQHENHRRMLIAELESAHASWQTLSLRGERFDRDILPEAQRRVEAALAGYRGGRVDLVAVIEARRAELELRLQRLVLQVERERARAQLDYLVARKG